MLTRKILTAAAKLLDIAQGLAYLHLQNIVHGDLHWVCQNYYHSGGGIPSDVDSCAVQRVDQRREERVSDRFWSRGRHQYDLGWIHHNISWRPRRELDGWQKNFLQQNREPGEHPPQTYIASARYAWRYATSNFGCIPAVNFLVADIDEGCTVAPNNGISSYASVDTKRAPNSPHGKRLSRPVDVRQSVGIGGKLLGLQSSRASVDGRSVRSHQRLDRIVSWRYIAEPPFHDLGLYNILSNKCR